MLCLIAAVLAASTCGIAAAESARQLALDYPAFDSQPAPYGWRALLDAGCPDAAVALLGAYETRNGAALADAEHLEMFFHMGQALAMSQRPQEALPYFQRAVGSAESGEWPTYVRGTIAFLKNDTIALKAARDAYARIAPRSMRLAVLDGFIACPHKTYSEAAHCKM